MVPSKTSTSRRFSKTSPENLHHHLPQGVNFLLILIAIIIGLVGLKFWEGGNLSTVGKAMNVITSNPCSYDAYQYCAGMVFGTTCAWVAGVEGPIEMCGEFDQTTGDFNPVLVATPDENDFKENCRRRCDRAYRPYLLRNPSENEIGGGNKKAYNLAIQQRLNACYTMCQNYKDPTAFIEGAGAVPAYDTNFRNPQFTLESWY